MLKLVLIVVMLLAAILIGLGLGGISGQPEAVSAGEGAGSGATGGRVAATVASAPESSFGKHGSGLAQPQMPAIDESNPVEVLGRIEQAASMLDPSYLRFISPYLKHRHPDVRAAAVSGIVNLGDVAGAAVLRSAAATHPDQGEALHMIEMAKWLELPPIPTEVLTQRILEARKRGEPVTSALRPLANLQRTAPAPRPGVRAGLRPSSSGVAAPAAK